MVRKNNLNSKGQVNLMETVAVLFIFFILLMFALIFYFKFQETNVQQKQVEIAASRAIDTTLVTLFLPEIQCSRGESEAEDNCVDITKLESFIDVVERHKNDYYFNLFSFSKISVHEVYPIIGNTSREWIIYDREKTTLNENNEVVPSWTFKEPTFFVVTLRDQLSPLNQGTYSFGYISVEVYS